MIVLSSGMQKAGSAWLFNLTNDMLVASGYRDCRELRDRYRLRRWMTAANCNIGDPALLKLILVGLPHFFGNTYALKTHEGPTSMVRWMIKSERMRATYIYRDPRDVAVSVFEHGRRLRERGAKSNTGFDRISTLEDAIRFAQDKLSIWRAWSDGSEALLMRYEDLRENPLESCTRVADFLELPVAESELHAIIERYDAKRAASGQAPHPLHFNKGISGRWAQVLTPDQIELCQECYGSMLPEMGYAA
jgi:hypothetical protein